MIDTPTLAPAIPTLKTAVTNYFSGSEWSLSFEVGNATGFDVRRHADAVAMNLWPSRGLSIHGIEMKISRGDWQRELAAPEKAEEVHQHCDYWWLAATRGVIKDVNEIPAKWGFLEMTESGSLRIRRQATKEDRADDIKRGFVAGILRSHQRAESRDTSAAVRAAVERAVVAERERAKNDRDTLLRGSEARLAKLNAALGTEKLGWLGDDEICQAVAFVLRTEATKRYAGLADVIDKFESARAAADHAVERIRHAAREFGIELPEPPPQAELSLRRIA